MTFRPAPFALDHLAARRLLKTNVLNQRVLPKPVGDVVLHLPVLLALLLPSVHKSLDLLRREVATFEPRAFVSPSVVNEPPVLSAGDAARQVQRALADGAAEAFGVAALTPVHPGLHGFSSKRCELGFLQCQERFRRHQFAGVAVDSQPDCLLET